MGLDYSYLLYFKQDQLWAALDALTSIAVPYHPPATILFPDGARSVPLESWMSKGRTLHHNDPELHFSTVLYFEEDDAITDYLILKDRGEEKPDQNRLVPEDSTLVTIGYIYLTIYNDLSCRIELAKPSDLILFDFGTTGTRMSMLFNYSSSIRNTFSELLDKADGLCGVFNREDSGGELFWLGGHRLSEWLTDAYVTDEEIEELLERFGER